MQNDMGSDYSDWQLRRLQHDCVKVSERVLNATLNTLQLEIKAVHDEYERMFGPQSAQYAEFISLVTQKLQAMELNSHVIRDLLSVAGTGVAPAAHANAHYNTQSQTLKQIPNFGNELSLTTEPAAVVPPEPSYANPWGDTPSGQAPSRALNALMPATWEQQAQNVPVPPAETPRPLERPLPYRVDQAITQPFEPLNPADFGYQGMELTQPEPVVEAAPQYVQPNWHEEPQPAPVQLPGQFQAGRSLTNQSTSGPQPLVAPDSKSFQTISGQHHFGSAPSASLSSPSSSQASSWFEEPPAASAPAFSPAPQPAPMPLPGPSPNFNQGPLPGYAQSPTQAVSAPAPLSSPVPIPVRSQAPVSLSMPSPNPTAAQMPAPTPAPAPAPVSVPAPYQSQAPFQSPAPYPTQPTFANQQAYPNQQPNPYQAQAPVSASAPAPPAAPSPNNSAEPEMEHFTFYEHGTPENGQKRSEEDYTYDPSTAWD